MEHSPASTHVPSLILIQGDIGIKRIEVLILDAGDIPGDSAWSTFPQMMREYPFLPSLATYRF